MQSLTHHPEKHNSGVPRRSASGYRGLPRYRPAPQTAIECANAARWRVAFAQFGDECARRRHRGTIPSEFSQGARR